MISPKLCSKAKCQKVYQFFFMTHDVIFSAKNSPPTKEKSRSTKWWIVSPITPFVIIEIHRTNTNKIPTKNQFLLLLEVKMKYFFSRQQQEDKRTDNKRTQNSDDRKWTVGRVASLLIYYIYQKKKKNLKKKKLKINFLNKKNKKKKI